MPAPHAKTSARAIAQLVRRKKVLELRQGGKLELEIAHELKVSQGTVSRDLKAIRQQLLDAILPMDGALLAEEIERYRRLEREALAGWERSCKPKQKTTVKEKVVDGEARTETSITEEGQAGDPSFLAQARENVTARLKALGLIRDEVELTGPGGGAVAITVVEVVKDNGSGALRSERGDATPESAPGAAPGVGK